MTSIAERSLTIAAAHRRSFAQAQLAGADTETAFAIAAQHIAIGLQSFQDDLLESQRQTAMLLKEVLK